MDQAQTVSLLGLSELLQADSVDADEAGSVARSKVTNLIHGAFALVVQLLGVGPATNDAEHALVNAAADGAVDLLLGLDDAGLEELALGGEVQTVVEDLGVVEGDELVTESTDLTVHDQSLEIDVGAAEHGETGSLVAATRLQADEAVLDDVDTADTVLAGDDVGSEEEFDGVGDDLLTALVLELDGKTLLEREGEVLGDVGCLGGIDSQLPHVLWWGDIGVLEDAGLVGAVCQVLIHAPGLALGACDGDASSSRVVKQVVAALESVVEDGLSPWSEHNDAGLEGVEGQLEADLVVTLAGAAVGDGEAALLLSDGDLGAGDDGAGERGAEQVDVLVDGVAGDGWVAQLLDELGWKGESRS